MNSLKTPSNGRSHTLHQKSVSYDCIKASSCIELADIRKLDSLLNQCESISCDNLLLYDEIYNYDVCGASKRKYVSTSALNRILPKNSIRRRTYKKVLAIRESDTKIIKLIDDKRHHQSTTDVEAETTNEEELTKCCELTNDKCENDDAMLRTQSCSSLIHHPTLTTTSTTTSTINCCDKTIQTSYGDLYGRMEDVVACKYLSTDGTCNNQIQQTLQDKRKKAKRKQCACRDYENTNLICETSLTTVSNNLELPAKTASPSSSWSASNSLRNPPTNPTKKSLLQLKRDKSAVDKSSVGRSKRFTKQKNTTVDDDECGGNGNGHNSDGCHENRVININDKSVEIFPISLNSSFSQSATPRGGTTTNLHHDSKSDKSETQSQKSKRSKFSPGFLTRKLTSRLNSEDDGAGGVKESLLGRSKSAEKKLPEPVETVCIDDIPSPVPSSLHDF
jgi:hypothetical protein